MKKYLLDTNMVIYFFKDKYGLRKRIIETGIERFYLSEVSVAELRYGVECSSFHEIQRKRARLLAFLAQVQILPIGASIEFFAKEKARLKLLGELIADFDLLIGATAISNDMVLVTNNEKHFSRLSGIVVENWATV